MFLMHTNLISLECCAQILYIPVSEHFSFSKIIHPGVGYQKLWSIYGCNKALLCGKTHSDRLDLAPQWVGLCPPRPTPTQIESID
jgi:hypothetical protein